VHAAIMTALAFPIKKGIVGKMPRSFKNRRFSPGYFLGAMQRTEYPALFETTALGDSTLTCSHP
jgi:hypothetical protein